MFVVLHFLAQQEMTFIAENSSKGELPLWEEQKQKSQEEKRKENKENEGQPREKCFSY